MRDAHSYRGSVLFEVVAARTARVTFGLALMGGALFAVTGAFAVPAMGGAILLLTLPAAVALAFLVGRLALLFAPWLAAQQPAFGGGPTTPVSALASPGESVDLHALAGRLEPWSYALPLVGLSFVAPLSIHAPVFLFASDGLLALGQWIAASTLLVGIAHLTLAGLSLRFGLKLYRGTLTRSAEREAMRALGLTTLMGCVPGVFFFGIPPLLVAITGMFFVPASFVVIERCCAYERALLRG